MARVGISLGSNLGDRIVHLRTAVERLGSSLHAETGRDYTLFSVALPVDAIDAALEVCGDLFTYPRFDDIELASMAEPSLTTIRQRTENQGRLMARLLLRQIGHEVADVESESEPSSADGRGIVQPVDLIERESA